MAPRIVNVLLTTFPGLGLPATLSLHVSSSSTISEVERLVSERLPSSITNLTLTTTSNKLLTPRRNELITALLDSEDDAFLPLRLSAQLCGGKGGFGSQLRAAGGRMASRKKRGVETNGSNRNLDGHRIRSVNEAKALAEYLAIKPGMDNNEKEQRRNRWMEVVKIAEKKKEEIKSGRKTTLDSKWLEDRDDASEKTRAAVLAMLSAGEIQNLLAQAESDVSGDASEVEGSSSEEDDNAGETKSNFTARENMASIKAPIMRCHGFDDEEMSDEDDVEVSSSAVISKEKGKSKV